MKLMHRYGWKLSCGCEPPVGKMACGLIEVCGLSVPYGVMVAACVAAGNTEALGVAVEARLADAIN